MPYASLNGQEIFFEDSGGDGFPVVMMHGFLMDQQLFDPQIQVLAPQYRCIRFDARAFGKTRWNQKPFSLYDTVLDCIGLMDFLAIKRAVIVGMSQGGYAALRLALAYPERVNSLVLMSTQSATDEEQFRTQCLEARDTWKEHGPIEPLIDALAAALLGPKEKPGAAKHWDAWLPKWKLYPKEAIFHAINCLNDRDNIEDRIGEIKHPTLITHGDADTGVPLALGQKLSTQLPHCHGLIVVAGAAHAANYTHPHEINKAMMDFLRNCTTQL